MGLCVLQIAARAPCDVFDPWWGVGGEVRLGSESSSIAIAVAARVWKSANMEIWESEHMEIQESGKWEICNEKKQA